MKELTKHVIIEYRLSLPGTNVAIGNHFVGIMSCNYGFIVNVTIYELVVILFIIWRRV